MQSRPPPPFTQTTKKKDNNMSNIINEETGKLDTDVTLSNIQETSELKYTVSIESIADLPVNREAEELHARMDAVTTAINANNVLWQKLDKEIRKDAAALAAKELEEDVSALTLELDKWGFDGVTCSIINVSISHDDDGNVVMKADCKMSIMTQRNIGRYREELIGVREIKPTDSLLEKIKRAAGVAEDSGNLQTLLKRLHTDKGKLERLHRSAHSSLVRALAESTTNGRRLLQSVDNSTSPFAATYSDVDAALKLRLTAPVEQKNG